jgi:hypothetical protein
MSFGSIPTTVTSFSGGTARDDAIAVFRNGEDDADIRPLRRPQDGLRLGIGDDVDLSSGQGWNGAAGERDIEAFGGEINRHGFDGGQVDADPEFLSRDPGGRHHDERGCCHSQHARLPSPSPPCLVRAYREGNARFINREMPGWTVCSGKRRVASPYVSQ